MKIKEIVKKILNLKINQAIILITLSFFAIVFAASIVNAVSCPVFTKSAIKTPDSSSVYYVDNNCFRRPIRKPEVFFTYFSSWSDVEIVSKATFDKIMRSSFSFMPWGPKKNFRSGTLVKTLRDPKVYILLGNKKCWIKNKEVFNELRYKYSWVEDVDRRLLKRYETCEEPIDYTGHHPPGTLIKYPDSNNVYILKKQGGKIKKRLIEDEQEFNQFGYRWDRIITIDSSETYPYNLNNKRKNKGQACNDGTEVNSCSSKKPLYCNRDAQLVKAPNKCGCPEYKKIESGKCVTENKCVDGTFEGSCSTNKPLYCSEGNLIKKPEKCGCSNDKTLKSGNCVSSCSDGTSLNACSSDKPNYCNSEGNLVKKPDKCGCSSIEKLKSENCVPRNKCSGGTFEGNCSVNKPKFCLDGKLVDAARICGCPAGKQQVGRVCMQRNISTPKLSSCNTKCGDGICQKSEKLDNNWKYSCPRDCVSKSKYNVHENGDAAIIAPKDSLKSREIDSALDQLNIVKNNLPKILGFRICSPTHYIWERLDFTFSGPTPKTDSGWQRPPGSIASMWGWISKPTLHEYSHVYDSTLLTKKREKIEIGSWFTEGSARYVEETFGTKFKLNNYRYKQSPSVHVICKENGYMTWNRQEGEFSGMKAYKDIANNSVYDVKDGYDMAYCMLKRLEREFGRESLRRVRRKTIKGILGDQYTKKDHLVDDVIIPTTGPEAKDIVKDFGF